MLDYIDGFDAIETAPLSTSLMLQQQQDIANSCADFFTIFRKSLAGQHMPLSHQFATKHEFNYVCTNSTSAVFLKQELTECLKGLIQECPGPD